ncbi:MAG: mandelate racemase/muconate lactonizing enzyme family protein [Gaiellales bacterium]
MDDVIRDVEAFPLRGSSRDGIWGPAYGFVVKVTTEDGLTGFGESDTSPAIAHAVITAAYTNPFDSGLRELLVNSPADPGAAWESMRQAVIQYGRDGVVVHAMAAVDIALWDIAGKRAEKPIVELLGGRRRGQLRCYGTHPLASSMERNSEAALRLVESGFDAVKFGWAPFGTDASHDEMIVRTLREAIGPGVDLLIDVGTAWDVDTAISRANLLEPYDLLWLEEVLPPYDYSGYEIVCREVTTPIAAGEMAARADELINLVALGCVDILQIDVSRTGLTQAQRVIAAAEEHGIPIVNHTYGHVLNAAASLHLMGAAAEVSLFEWQATPNEIRDALNHGQVQAVRGLIEVPSSPGLGVEVDEAALRFYSQV